MRGDLLRPSQSTSNRMARWRAYKNCTLAEAHPSLPWGLPECPHCVADQNVIRRFVPIATECTAANKLAIRSPRRRVCLRASVLPHQPGLLMLKNVAMIHERVGARCRLIESDEKLRFILDKDHVLPAREMSRRRRSREG
jgi:hypothetical protein